MTVQLTEQITQRIDSAPGCVYLPEDFYDLGKQDDVERALDELIEMRTLSPIGEGLLAKIRSNRITNEPMLDAPGGFEQVAYEALDRLGIEWLEGTAKTNYQQGAKHIPASTFVRILGEERPLIAFQTYRLRYE